MKELREIGKPMGAYDTSKSELIQEILVKQGNSADDTKKLIDRIIGTKGDLVETYSLRDWILDKLRKLLKLEGKNGG